MTEQKRVMSMGRQQLIARVIEADGYLLGCTDNLKAGWRHSFWQDDSEEAEQIYVEVPPDMVEGLLAHGTAEQVYSDGYEAWEDIERRGVKS